MIINIEKVQTRLKIAQVENQKNLVKLYEELIKTYKERTFEDMEIKDILLESPSKYGLVIEDLYKLN
jgi:hypothetical protein